MTDFRPFATFTPIFIDRPAMFQMNMTSISLYPWLTRNIELCNQAGPAYYTPLHEKLLVDSE